MRLVGIKNRPITAVRSPSNVQRDFRRRALNPANTRMNWQFGWRNSYPTPLPDFPERIDLRGLQLFGLGFSRERECGKKPNGRTPKPHSKHSRLGAYYGLALSLCHKVHYGLGSQQGQVKLECASGD